MKKITILSVLCTLTLIGCTQNIFNKNNNSNLEDGMYAKIFIDMGIIGMLLFFSYYYIFLKSYKVIALAAIIFSLTIDFFTASKVMFAFYLSVYYLKLIRQNQ